MKCPPPNFWWLIGSLRCLTIMRSPSTFFCPGPYPCLCACVNSPFYKNTIMSLFCSCVTMANCTCNIPRMNPTYKSGDRGSSSNHNRVDCESYVGYYSGELSTVASTGQTLSLPVIFHLLLQQALW